MICPFYICSNPASSYLMLLAAPPQLMHPWAFQGKTSSSLPQQPPPVWYDPYLASSSLPFSVSTPLRCLNLAADFVCYPATCSYVLCCFKKAQSAKCCCLTTTIHVLFYQRSFWLTLCCRAEKTTTMALLSIFHLMLWIYPPTKRLSRITCKPLDILNVHLGNITVPAFTFPLQYLQFSSISNFAYSTTFGICSI